MRAVLLAFAVLISAVGCNIETGLAPVETVIPKSSERDFGFVVTWIPTPNPEVGSVDAFEITITSGETYKAVATDPSGEIDEVLAVEFQAHEMSPDHPHAIVELKYQYDKVNAYRRLAIAAVIEEKLYLWAIDGRKMAAHLFDDGVTALSLIHI